MRRRSKWQRQQAGQRAMRSRISRREELDPQNRDDAEYIVGHPTEFTAEMNRLANETLDDLYGNEPW